MGLDITQTTPDPISEDESGALVDAIVRESSKQRDGLVLQGSLKPDELSYKINNLQEYFYERISLLGKNNLDGHHVLWLISLKSLGSYLVQFKTYFAENFLEDVPYDEPLSASSVSLSLQLAKLYGDYVDLVTQFLGSKHLVVSKYLISVQSRKHHSDFLSQVFCDFLIDSLELLIMDEPGDMLANPTYLYPIQLAMSQYFDQIPPNSLLESSSMWFPLLSQFLRVAYIVGESSLILPFVEKGIIHPQLGIDKVKSSGVDLVDLINYYRYTAFNLVTVSLETSKSHYNTQAAIYFSVLLGLPNLSLSVYEPLYLQIQEESSKGIRMPDFGNDSNSNLLISLLERQEISMLYILNGLMKLTSIRQYLEIGSGNALKKELTFFIASLSASLSQEIDRHASRSSSIHSSTVSFDKLREQESQKRREVRQFKQLNRFRLNSLSTVINHGSYKEKLVLIVHVFEQFSKHKLDFVTESFTGEQTDLLFSTGDQSRGKSTYISAIQGISKSLKALSINHLVKECGLNQFQESHLAKICSPHSVEECLLAKDLRYRILEQNGTRIVVLEHKVRTPRSAGETVKKQLQISRLSEQLKEVISSRGA